MHSLQHPLASLWKCSQAAGLCSGLALSGFGLILQGCGLGCCLQLQLELGAPLWWQGLLNLGALCARDECFWGGKVPCPVGLA